MFSRVKRIVVLATLLAVVSCAGHKAPVIVVQTTGTVVDAATALQKAVTAATDAGVLPVPLAQKLTGYNEVIYAKSGTLLEAVRAYSTLQAPDLKKLKAAEVQQLVADVNAQLARFLKESLPQGVLSQLTALVGNVMSAVSAVQLQVAKGLGT